GRGPNDPPPGALRRITISNVIASGIDPRYAATIAGLPGHPVEDVTLSHVRLVYRGGGSREDAEREPPENEAAYPEPSMFGPLPPYGLFVRHARGLTLRDVSVSFDAADLRPPLLLHDAADVFLDHVEARRGSGVPFAVLREVSGLVV